MLHASRNFLCLAALVDLQVHVQHRKMEILKTKEEESEYLIIFNVFETIRRSIAAIE